MLNSKHSDQSAEFELPLQQASAVKQIVIQPSIHFQEQSIGVSKGHMVKTVIRLFEYAL